MKIYIIEDTYPLSKRIISVAFTSRDKAKEFLDMVYVEGIESKIIEIELR